MNGEDIINMMFAQGISMDILASISFFFCFARSKGRPFSLMLM
jgi:hypothetical protein